MWKSRSSHVKICIAKHSESAAVQPTTAGFLALHSSYRNGYIGISLSGCLVRGVGRPHCAVLVDHSVPNQAEKISAPKRSALYQPTVSN